MSYIISHDPPPGMALARRLSRLDPADAKAKIQAAGAELTKSGVKKVSLGRLVEMIGRAE
jgi:hypothetical protein